MSNPIRTVKIDGQSYYSVKDILNKYNVKRVKVLDDGSIPVVQVNFPTKVGKRTIRVWQRAVTRQGFDRLKAHLSSKGNQKENCKKKGKKEPQTVVQQLNDLKTRMYDLLTEVLGLPDVKDISGLGTEHITPTKITKFRDKVIQDVARDRVVSLVIRHAQKIAKEQGLTGEDSRLIHELAYNKLYSAFRDVTNPKIDLKELAQKENTSAIQVAHRMAIADKLLYVAEYLFGQRLTLD